MADAGIRKERWRRLPWLLSAALHLSLLWYIAAYRWPPVAAPPPPLMVRLVPLAALSPPAPAAPAPLPAEAAAPPPPPVEAAPPAPPPAEAELAPPAPPPTTAPEPEQDLAAQPPSSKPDVASNAPAPPSAQRPPASAPTITPELQEITRDGFAGMKTAPLSRTAPLTAEQWNKLDKTYNVGAPDSGTYVEAGRAPRRAAASERAPPLTNEQWAALNRIHHVGAGDGGAYIEAMRGPLRAAASQRAPPLTKEEWATLDKILFVGEPASGRDVRTEEAARRGALSVMTAFNTPAQDVQYGYGSALRHGGVGGIAARVIDKPMPEIAPTLAPTGGTLVATARFAVAADGTAKVDLTGPTPEPKLNEVLLAALQKWRFTPAYQGGSPVASMLEVRLTISAR